MTTTRRHLLTIAPTGAAMWLTGCTTGSTGAVELANAKIWVGTLGAALTAAANVYLAQPNAPNAPQITQWVSDLKIGVEAFQSLGDVSSAQAAAKSLLDLASKLVSVVTPFIPSQYAQYVPLAIAIVQAFVAALPPPAGAPAVPPAAIQAPKASAK